MPFPYFQFRPLYGRGIFTRRRERRSRGEAIPLQAMPEPTKQLAGDRPAQRVKMPWQFRLRSLFILTAIVSVGCWAASVRLLEDITLAEFIIIALAAWLLFDAGLVLSTTKKRREFSTPNFKNLPPLSAGAGKTGSEPPDNSN